MTLRSQEDRPTTMQYDASDDDEITARYSQTVIRVEPRTPIYHRLPRHADVTLACPETSRLGRTTQLLAGAVLIALALGRPWLTTLLAMAATIALVLIARRAT